MAYNTVNDLFTAIANAIRTKTGKTGKIATQDMPVEIESITTGGGSEDWKLTNANYVAYYNKSAIENIDNLLKHIDFTSIKEVEYLYNASSTTTYGYLEANTVKKILSQITNVTKLRNSFSGLYKIVGDVTFDVNLPNCTDLAGCFNSIAEYTGDGKITFDFHGSTGKITSWGFLSAYTAWGKAVKAMLNLNMDKATSCNGLTNHAEATRLTFDGSFGGSSTISSLTLNLSGWTSLTAESFLETMTTISENTNGNTRIFKLPAALYDSLTDEILDLADEKGYTLSS